jgi:adenine phosphoribosyltransferase
VDAIKSKIRTIPHFPKQGIMFRDITTLLKDAQGFRKVVDELVQRYTGTPIDVIVGLEARGFILGGAIAHQLGKGFVPIRKAGKLPHKTEMHEYELEYGTDKIEVHVDAIEKGDKVLIVDDLLATGGTALAAAALVEKLGGDIVEMAFIVDLPDVGGQKKIKEKGYKMFTLCEFEGD